MSKTLSLEKVQAYRDKTYRRAADQRISEIEAAIEYVNELGFIYFWPIKNIVMPSLWVAVNGERPVPNEHDDPGHITWQWKDSLLGKRRWYYAKILRKKATIISAAMAPYFYALSENYGSPESDYIDQYRQGLLTQEAKTIYATLLREGPLNSVALRKAALMADNASKYRFSRGLDTLQADFKILPTGVAEAGTWRYAFVYDCVHRHYPDLPAQARGIGLAEARQKLLETYFHAVGAATKRDMLKVFQWPKPVTEKALTSLVKKGSLVRGLSLTGQKDEWITRTDL